jgi:hypothetical protein
MAITEKENILKFYRHETPDHLPDLRYLHTLIGYGYLERPLEPAVVEKLRLEPEKFPQYKDKVSMRDWFGVEYIFEPGIGGSMPDVTKPYILTDIDKWREQVTFPDIDAYDWDAAARFDHIDMIDREHKALSVLVQCGLYERMHALAGMENSLVWMLTDPDETMALLEAIANHKLKLFEKIIQHYKPDILRHHDDYGSQRALQMSPGLWREMIKPFVARFVKLCHDNGVFYEQHSCGFIEDIIPDFVEIGVDSWQGMHINDVPKLKKMTNNRLNYHMSLDNQRYMADDLAGQLTEGILRADIRDTVTVSAAGGSYFPVIALNGSDEKWWATPIMRDELQKCYAEVRIN